ncbi:putative EKC/KEOPS complex, subunit Pcc1 protein [Pseudoloma neurophilia]|uniref:Putative EKC/KEOPS complex, subunit Pcc1 protein n=1 Tax=Pseudoloma neurophilia TaxID=146866 RepID=A0A0R0M845_9MICR|nr:putative EKC/KEOPS complex, subunit Pcc1 protein [Pseudoloma neurophilia]
MDYSAEIRIKNENVEKIKQILEIDQDYREDTSTVYEIKGDQLIVMTQCSNITSLSKSLQESMKKIKLIEEVVSFIEENV